MAAIVGLYATRKTLPKMKLLFWGLLIGNISVVLHLIGLSSATSLAVNITETTLTTIGLLFVSFWLLRIMNSKKK